MILMPSRKYKCLSVFDCIVYRYEEAVLTNFNEKKKNLIYRDLSMFIVENDETLGISNLSYALVGI